MRNVIVAVLLSVAFFEASAQRSVTAAIKNFNRTGTDFSFDIYARSTGSPQINLGWANFFFYLNSSALSSPTLTNINSKFTGDSVSTDYAPMRVTILSTTPPRLGVQVYYTGHGAGTGQPLVTTAPDGERICTVRLTLTSGSANSDISWDAGGSYANTWILSKDTVQVGNTISGVGSITSDVPVGSGWNMISVPVTAVDMRTATLFTGATSPTYGFNNGYFTADTLYNGKGYWIKFGAADTFTVFGPKVVPPTIAVASGWNMIGPLDFNVRTVAITSTPSGIITTPYYEFNGGYNPVDTLKRGKGYWVKTSGAGTLNFANAAAKIAVPASSLIENWTRLEVEDALGKKGSLYLAKREELTQNYELPPLGPSGIFDLRYESNVIAEPLGQGVHLAQLKGTTPPLKLKAFNLNGMSLHLRDDIDGKSLDATLREGGEITVASNVRRFEIREVGTASKQLPTTFELNQNYPNPFNPTTVIKFALPKDVHVEISVFNVLGQKVADIIDADYVAGYHHVEFNATPFASGMYLYKIAAGGFVQSRKMLILK